MTAFLVVYLTTKCHIWCNGIKKLDNKRFKHKEKQQNIVAVFYFQNFQKGPNVKPLVQPIQTFIKNMQNGLLRVERGCLPCCIK